MHAAARRFADARKANKAIGAGRTSGDKRSAEAKGKCETIAARWPLPSADYPTQALLDEADVSRNTAILHLGKRPEAQRAHQIQVQANAKRAAARAKRKEKE